MKKSIDTVLVKKNDSVETSKSELVALVESNWNLFLEELARWKELSSKSNDCYTVY